MSRLNSFRMNTLPAAGALAASFFILSGCGSEPKAERDVELKVLDAWVHSGRQSEREAITGQVARFNAEHPDIRSRRLPSSEAIKTGDEIEFGLKVDEIYLFEENGRGI